jgi:hypothetical protein
MDPTVCRLCGAPLPVPEGADGTDGTDDAVRCPNCGLWSAGDLGGGGYGRVFAGLAGVYVITALLVLLTRG